MTRTRTTEVQIKIRTKVETRSEDIFCPQPPVDCPKGGHGDSAGDKGFAVFPLQGGCPPPGQQNRAQRPPEELSALRDTQGKHFDLCSWDVLLEEKQGLIKGSPSTP